jgi:hypothetical protein
MGSHMRHIVVRCDGICDRRCNPTFVTPFGSLALPPKFIRMQVLSHDPVVKLILLMLLAAQRHVEQPSPGPLHFNAELPQDAVGFSRAPAATDIYKLAITAMPEAPEWADS